MELRHKLPILRPRMIATIAITAVASGTTTITLLPPNTS
jgi:hypothetical protein